MGKQTDWTMGLRFGDCYALKGDPGNQTYFPGPAL